MGLRQIPKREKKLKVLLTIAIVWPLGYSISFTVRADLRVAHLIPKCESPQLRVILVPFNANFSCTAVIFEVSVTLHGWEPHTTFSKVE